MSTPSFAVAAGSTITGFNNGANSFRVCVADAEIDRQHEAIDITQQGDTDTYTIPTSTTVTCNVVRASKRHVMRINGFGVFQTSSDAGATWSPVYADPGAGVSGAIHARVSRAILVRQMGLLDVTSSSDALPKTIFAITKPSYAGSIEGWLTDTETPLDDATATTLTTLSLPLGSGTVSALATFSAEVQGMRFNRGGPHDFKTPFDFSGPVTKASTPFDVLEFPAILGLDNGQTMTGDVKLSYLRTDIDYRKAAPLLFQFSGVVSDFAFV